MFGKHITFLVPGVLSVKLTVPNTHSAAATTTTTTKNPSKMRETFLFTWLICLDIK
jgi:hypothetical protein